MRKGWKRPERNARWSSNIVELVVAREFAGDKYIAYMRAQGDWEIGAYATEDEAMIAAEEYAAKEIEKVLQRLKQSTGEGSK